VRAVPQVAVQGGDDGAVRRVDPGLQRGGLAEAAPQDQSAHVARTRGDRLADARGGRVAAGFMHGAHFSCVRDLAQLHATIAGSKRTQ
jgi:hypothetical protein